MTEAPTNAAVYEAIFKNTVRKSGNWLQGTALSRPNFPIKAVPDSEDDPRTSFGKGERHG